MTTMTRAAVLAVVMMTAACAGRAPQPVAVVKGDDVQLTCMAITTEVGANDTKIKDLGRESGNKVAQNVAAGVAGLLIWPLWFAMDFQGAADKETVALQQRQQYLASLAKEKACAIPQQAQ